MLASTTIKQYENHIVVTAKGIRKDFKSILEGTLKIKEAAKAHGVRYVIADYRNLRFEVALAEAFNLVKTYENEIPEFGDIVISAVVSKTDMEIGKFWESICLKRGYPYKVFLDYSKAEAWITEQAVART